MMISSPTHPLVKHLTKLREKKAYRYAQSRLVVTSKALIKELSSKMTIKTLVTLQDVFIDAEETVIMTEALLQKITGLPTTDGAIAEVEMPHFQDLSSQEKIIIFDGVRDPGNLGTMLRTAHALGFDGAHFLENCCDPFNDKTLRAAKQATFDLALGKGPLPENRNLYVAHMEGTELNQMRFEEPYGIVFGNEGEGVSPSILESATPFRIPMREGVDSLNVSAACAITLFTAGMSYVPRW